MPGSTSSAVAAQPFAAWVIANYRFKDVLLSTSASCRPERRRVGGGGGEATLLRSRTFIDLPQELSNGVARVNT